ncbi:hypothetical protein V5799_017717 [Amblyomma americanum]|uniref:Uncharacterized protein n=1 Tax=Amblyomma americanum TaxID=6943 RepID=A0AAQ4F1Y7_AMBAM
MESLEQLDVILSPLSIRDLALIAEVVAQNTSLRRVSVTCGTGPAPLTMEDYHYMRFMNSGRAAERMQPWLWALRQTSWLTRLTFDLLSFGEDECCDFFRAVAEVKSLRDVRVRNLPPSVNLLNICHTIRECGIVDKVVVENYYLSGANVSVLSACTEVKIVTIHSSYFPTIPSLCWVLGVLGGCPQITSVCAIFRHGEFGERVQDAMANYVASAPSTLERVDIRTPDDLYDWMEPQSPDASSSVVSALCTKSSLRAIALSVLRMSEKDSKMLARAAMQSRRLERVSLSTTYGLMSAAFHRSLAPCVDSNYRLLHVGFSGMSRPVPMEEAAVMRATGRNRGLVERAARFVLGRRNRYCACAFEMVSLHPRVAEIVREQAVVGPIEAKWMIRIAAKSLVSLHDYMRLTGVVKDSVQCYGPREAGMQLDDLDEDSWWHVRKYLKVSDVEAA